VESVTLGQVRKSFSVNLSDSKEEIVKRSGRKDMLNGRHDKRLAHSNERKTENRAGKKGDEFEEEDGQILRVLLTVKR
jgi:hypothetical protein